MNVNVSRGVAQFDILEPIGDAYNGVSAKTVADALGALPATVTQITVRLSSIGGDPFDGVAIAAALRDQRASKGRTVTVEITGLAASAASIVAMGGGTIRIAANALMMIHNPLTVTVGDADEHRANADALDHVRDSIVATYQWHSRHTAEELKALMRAVTWMDADEAIANGLATEKTSGGQATASAQAAAPRNLLDKIGAPPAKFAGAFAAHRPRAAAPPGTLNSADIYAERNARPADQDPASAATTSRNTSGRAAAQAPFDVAGIYAARNAGRDPIPEPGATLIQSSERGGR